MLAPWCSAELRRAGQVYLPTHQRAKIGRVGEVSCGAVGAEGETLQGEKEIEEKGERRASRGRSRSAPPSLRARVLHPSPVGLQQQGGPVPRTWVCVPVLPRVLKEVRPPHLGVLPGRCQPEPLGGPRCALPASSWPAVLTQESRGCSETPVEIRKLQSPAPTSWSGINGVFWRRGLHVYHHLLELTHDARATSHRRTRR